ncbi:MAG: PilN domain-containing protein [Candidatus Woesebacteria bacterium]|nr:PilN domain-containing protein [Candidatus Woesebacteria bacterium]
MPINRPKHINLLPSDNLQSTTLGRILKWALSSFRVMVIITELIVMSAFLSRFWLDSRNSDLNEEIDINKAQVLAYAEVEKEFRMYQKKLSVAKDLYSESKRSDLVKKISDLMPSDLVLSSIQESEGGIQIKALSYSERSIVQFLINLESLKEITDVNLSQVASSIENSSITTFTISAKVNSTKKGEN